MSLINIADRFAALLGISCIILSVLTLYNLAVLKNNDIIYLATIITPLTIISALLLKYAIQIYTSSYAPIRIGQAFKAVTFAREKDK